LRVAICAAGELWGGVERFVETLAPRLATRGIAAEVLLFYDHLLRRRLEEAGIPVTLVGTASRYDPRQLLRIIRLLRDHDINVLHVHGYKATVLGGVAARLTSVPLVRTEHGRLEPRQGLGRVKMMANTTLERLLSGALAQTTVHVSADIQNLAAGRHARGRQTVIYNGIEPDGFAGPRAPMPVDLASDRDVFRVGIVGRVSPVKGHETLLRAWSRLTRLSRLRLYVVGSGPSETACRALAQTLGVESSVRFLGFRDDVPRLLSHLDLLVMPSLHEGLPYTLLEAMLAGVPVLASATGGLREVIVHGVNGLLVPPGDEGALADAIARAYADPALRLTLVEHAYNTIRSKFLADAMVDRYVEVYRDAVGGGPQRAFETETAGQR
jgi:L-malate glycosyltransferase